MLKSGVPEGPDPSQDECESYLAELRESREELIPTPAEELDDVMQSWFGSAEELVFDCDSGTYSDGASDLEILTAEIDGGLGSL